MVEQKTFKAEHTEPKTTTAKQKITKAEQMEAKTPTAEQKNSRVEQTEAEELQGGADGAKYLWGSRGCGAAET